MIPFSCERVFLMLQSEDKNRNSRTANTPDHLIKFFPDIHSGYSEAPMKYSYIKFNGAGVPSACRIKVTLNIAALRILSLWTNSSYWRRWNQLESCLRVERKGLKPLFKFSSVHMLKIRDLVIVPQVSTVKNYKDLKSCSFIHLSIVLQLSCLHSLSFRGFLLSYVTPASIITGNYFSAICQSRFGSGWCLFFFYYQIGKVAWNWK